MFTVNSTCISYTNSQKKYSQGLIIQIELTAEKKEVNLSLLNSRHGENRKIWHDVYSLYPCKCKVF